MHGEPACYGEKREERREKRIFAKVSFGKALGGLGELGGCFGMLWDALGGSGEALGSFGEALGRLCGGLGKVWGAWGRLLGPPAARPPEDIYTNYRSTAPAAPY